MCCGGGCGDGVNCRECECDEKAARDMCAGYSSSIERVMIGDDDSTVLPRDKNGSAGACCDMLTKAKHNERKNA